MSSDPAWIVRNRGIEVFVSRVVEGNALTNEREQKNISDLSRSSGLLISAYGFKMIGWKA